MSLPQILKSKFFWSFSLVTGSVSSAVAYDRYEAHRLRQEFLAEARNYGKEPLPVSAQPRCLSFFLISPSATDHRATLQALRSYALDILTAAGVDYRWVIQVDGEEAKAKWDELARERNEPELMREQAAIPLEELKSNILDHVILKKKNRSDSEEDKSAELLDSLRSIYAQELSTWPVASDGYVTFDSFTKEALQSALEEASKTEITVPVNPPKSSWWSRSSHTVNLIPVKQQHDTATFYHFPCTLSQSPLHRLRRFLFGQRELTRSIGEAVMQCIRQQNN